MNKISRRHFLHASIGATSGALLTPGQILAEEPVSSYQSGLVTGKPVPMPYQSIPGFLSESQLSPHYTAHYGGALKGYIAADKRLQSGITEGKGIDSSAYGAIQRARTTKANSVVLHELYFDGLTVKSALPGGALLAAINRRFGTFDRWADDFQACARAASGWAVFALHSLNGQLYNVISDQHDSGVLWMATPLLVIDMYEHAYYLDYKSDKPRYVAKFMDHIDWSVINRRFLSVS